MKIPATSPMTRHNPPNKVSIEAFLLSHMQNPKLVFWQSADLPDKFVDWDNGYVNVLLCRMIRLQSGLGIRGLDRAVLIDTRGYMEPLKYVSKSDFKAARECPAKLYYRKNKYPNLKQEDEF